MARSDRWPSNPVTWRRSVGACSAAFAAVLLAGVAPPAGAQDPGTADEVVLIAGVIPQADGSLTVIASPPPSASDTPLGTGDLVVTVDREPVASRMRPRDPADLAVAIVVQTSVGAEDLRAEQGAAVATIRDLPEAARTAVIAGGEEAEVVAPLGTDRGAATSAVGEIRPSAAGASAVAAVDLAVEELAEAPRRAIILFGPLGFADDSAVGALGERLRAERVTLFAVGPGQGPAAFQDVVLASGGRTLAAGTDDALNGAGRAVAVQLASQHLVTFTPETALSSAARISVASEGVDGSEALVPRDLMAGVVGADDPDGSRDAGGAGLLRGRDVPWTLVAVAAATALVLVGMAGLVIRRRRRRAGPAFAVPSARAVKAAPDPGEAGPATDGAPAGPPTAADGGPAGRQRPARSAPPRAGQVDEALDRLETFASRWQPRSQGVFFAHEALSMHQRAGIEATLEDLTRATALGVGSAELQSVVRTIEALRWSLVRRSMGGRWSDIAVEASAVLRGEFDPAVVARSALQSDAPLDQVRPTAALERLRGRRVLEDEVQVREPVRAAAIVRERVLEYQWFGAESELVSRILVPVLLYDRVPAAVPYLGVSRHLGASTDMSVFFQAATEAADDATRRIIQLRALRSRYQADLEVSAQTVVDLLFSVPVVTAAYLSDRLGASPAQVTELMDDLVSSGVVEAVAEPTRRGDPAWAAIEVLGVFDRDPAVPAAISLAVPSSAGSEPPDRGTHRRRAAPVRPRQLRARPRP